MQRLCYPYDKGSQPISARQLKQLLCRYQVLSSSSIQRPSRGHMSSTSETRRTCQDQLLFHPPHRTKARPRNSYDGSVHSCHCVDQGSYGSQVEPTATECIHRDLALKYIYILIALATLSGITAPLILVWIQQGHKYGEEGSWLRTSTNSAQTYAELICLVLCATEIMLLRYICECQIFKNPTGAFKGCIPSVCS
jgi:hypothetical protein